MISRRPATPLLAAIACIPLLTGGCAGGENTDDGPEPAAAEAADTSTTSLDTTAADDSTTADSIAAARGPDPFHGFDIDSVAEARKEAKVARLLLSNASKEEAVVYGTGGAGEVLLDTVPPESERRVDVTTRAVRLGVRSETVTGEDLRQDEVTVGVDSVLNVPVGRVAPIP